MTGSNVDSTSYDYITKFLKILAYIFVFIVVLCSAILSKGTLLLMTSQVKPNTTRPFCNKLIGHSSDVLNRDFVVTLPVEERAVWIWVLIFSYFVPQIATLYRSLRVCLFKSWKKTEIWQHLLPLFITETFPAIGSAILVFCILPELDVLKAAMLTNAFCFIPGLIACISRNPLDLDILDSTTIMILDIICIIAQATSFFMWPLLQGNSKLLLIPVSAIFISFGWWENYVDENAKIPFIRKLAQERRIFQNRTYFLYIFVSITNCLIFFGTSMVIFWIQEGELGFLFDKFGEAFSDRLINVTEVKMYVEDLASVGLDDTFSINNGTTVQANVWTPLTILIVNFMSSYICYAFVKFASKVSIQEFSFALAISMTIPVLLSILTVMTGEYLEDECNFTNILPGYLFFTPPPLYLLRDFLTQQYAWVWLLWFLSQVWITFHIWNPKCEKLANTENLFVRPMFDAFLIDQSVCMNRRRADAPIKAETKSATPITPKIYVCATMWHEIGEEMMTFFKSIMRLDEDHCAHRIAKYFMHVNVPSYYELECNIFFDDAFIRKSEKDQDPLLNSYVLEMISKIEVAASEVHGINMKLRPPKIYSTPYGGRIEWTLPGRTKLIVHLKDKAKIRAKKRWSQVMYMYYLLGHRLMDNPAIECKTATSENTFILALDGDIDFKPEAVHLLMEYMKKNKKLGAACGRIHPVGSGAIAWYQVFEYAVGHWLQKATEHVIGCVLCSPGCFSLFRSEVLMQDRVMCKYTTEATEARHRVQYDQGEDRWLCTLILQAGYRVEYAAASDSYTHCPEGFNEFYNQRRRWIPSTMANIIDVLGDYKHIIEVNDDISMFYIFYQAILLVGTIIEPGTIFLMLVGATTAVFNLDQWSSFMVNLLPISTFILICALCKDTVQLLAAGIISGMYGLIMTAVLVGVIMQIHDDGLLAPTSIFFFLLIMEFVVAAILHPKEYYCLKYGIIYYITVPSMYMLLMIYSVFNMNNVSWGTRDVTVAPSDETKPEDQKENQATATNKKDEGWLSLLGKESRKEDGSLELSCLDLFTCLFCTHPSVEQEKLKAIQKALEQLNKKLDSLGNQDKIVSDEPKPIRLEGATATPKNNGKEDPASKSKAEKESPDDIISNSWFYHKELIRGEVKWLDDKEEKFWSALIGKYLEPIDESDKKLTVGKELKDLRDKMVFTFFMLNAIFVLVIFLLTLEKDVIHLNWPYNPKINFTYSIDENQVEISKDYLQLEPIGFAVLLTFGSLLFIQSFGMLIHRFETFSQILSNTIIDWKLFKPDVSKDPETLKYVTRDNAVALAKKLQQLYDVSKSKDEINNERLPPGKRKSVFMPDPMKKKKPQIYDLVDSYKTRMKMYDDESFQGPVDRRTVDHIKFRHSEVIRKSQAHLLAQNAGRPIQPCTFYEMPELDGGETFS
ncbi:hypothetical protein HHI36_007337 [Cryptolaemus montrouzieri]|uniref:chitin synthase n=1 Tax=Cryptolaemus montrouzieri TaxID=559131 RepID=A0ABD2MPD3_9CUCU